MDHRPLVLLDVETTGGNARYARITEIGALRIERGEVVATYKQLINPQQKIPYNITTLTGISNEMVSTAPTFREIAEELSEFLDGAIFVAHHVVFDYSFVKAEFARVGQKYNSARICSVKLSRVMHPEQKRHGLDKVIERLGIKVVNRHRAFDDAEVIWKFVKDEFDSNELNLFRLMDKIIINTRAQIGRRTQPMLKGRICPQDKSVHNEYNTCKYGED